MIVNPRTDTLLRAYETRPVSSLILSGETGSDIYNIALAMSSNLLGPKLVNNLLIILPEEGKKIGIDSVRDLKSSFNTIIKAKRKIGRVAIIVSAEKLSREAQNALLKIIEEPVKNSSLILLTSDLSKLLPTIRSRCQNIPILPITKKQAYDYGEANGVSIPTIDRALLLSRGESMLFENIVSKESDGLTKQISNAKEFLGMSIFDRLRQQKTYSNTGDLNTLIDGLKRISEAAMHSAKDANVRRWHDTITTAQKCQKLLDANVVTKLVFLRLCIQL